VTNDRIDRILSTLTPKERAIVEARLAARPPAHVDPTFTIPPPAHDPGPVAELQPAGLPRVNLERLRAGCQVLGWRITVRNGGESFTIADGTSAVEYEAEVYADGVHHELSARGRFDEVLDMMAVIAAAAME